MQAVEVRVLALVRGPVDLSGLPLYSAFFFVTLFLLTCFLTVPLCVGRSTCSSDGALLSCATCRCRRSTARRPHVCD